MVGRSDPHGDGSRLRRSPRKLRRPPLWNDNRVRSGISEEFKHEPDVAFLIDQIKSTSERLEQAQGGDPALVATKRRFAKLK